jgi:aryl-alcohol dehydrogenase-like predicted oxidoreductase/predicted kinase
MRLPAGTDRETRLARETIAAAAAAGMTVFDTAHAYGTGEAGVGANERLLAQALAHSDQGRSARVITKGGMSRVGGAWVPDGRAKAIARDCEASLASLAPLAIDMYLIHAPDPRTPWRTSVRALARLVDQGLVQHVGLSNVNRSQLDEALELAPVAAVEVALSINDQRAARGGIVERCHELGIALLAHSPLGGPRRVGVLLRNQPLIEAAATQGVTAAELALAWLLHLSPAVIAIPGARRPESARSAARAATLTLDADGQEQLRRAFGGLPRAHAEPPLRGRDAGDVVIVMGIPGAGKSRLAEEYVGRGYVRLNRDERGGSLRRIADELEATLASGARRVVLDNTYLARSARSYVIETAARNGIAARCIWLSTPLAQAQVNLVARLLEQFETLPAPDELRRLSRNAAGILTPTSQMRALRELEEPSRDEGFAEVEVVPFARAPSSGEKRIGVLVAAAALRTDGWEAALEPEHRDAAHLVFDWRPNGTPELLARDVDQLGRTVAGPVSAALCPHGGGPPACWCRPPLPGLALAFARIHGLDLASSVVVGCRPTDRTLATALGARYIAV